MRRRTLLSLSALALAGGLPGATQAQDLGHERANIVSIDLGASKVELRDPKGRTFTRSFAKDATVKFTDGARFFPNPSVRDLRAPMYVHYMFRGDVIEQFDVVELGFDPSTAQKRPEPPGGASEAEGRVVRASPRAVVIETEGRRESYGVAEPNLLKKLPAGVTVRFSWVSKDGRRVITAVH
jgi:hypothetical protein